VRWTAKLSAASANASRECERTRDGADNCNLAGDLSGGDQLDGRPMLTLTATVVDDSHNHILPNVTGYKERWTP